MPDSLLVSAYDVHYENLEDSLAFASEFRRSRYAQPNLLILDSGWYEKNADGGGAAWTDLGRPKEWTREQYEDLLDGLDPELDALIVSWDDPKESHSYEEQIREATGFFGRRTRFASNILLKPPRMSQQHQFTELSVGAAGDLRRFDVVGVTEKDLGRTLLHRLNEIAELRARLDDAKVDAPIHVFGGLDPLFTPLYVAAGAEVFDGLSWVRFAYRDGQLVHIESAAVIDGFANESLEVVRAKAAIQNLGALTALEGELIAFARGDGDWGRLANGRRYFQRVFEQLEGRQGGGRHGR